ncbi:UDP-glycosyltransferase UGT5-like [Athalia rosae]|uniref:UDP-glycosyltransferase UGT5-like n=1 Tax=Athalia rosae TaxID=37344 RepID=UPI00203488B6|nr:UDP-glycosyltransferase UGT5-like [Athalia rosae]
MRLIATLVLLCLMGREGFGAKILGLLPFPGRSHLSVSSPVLHGLAKKGHDVTAYVPFSTGFNATNYREIVYEHTPITNSIDVLSVVNVNAIQKPFGFFFMGIFTTEMALNTTEVRDLIRSEEKYDLIVMEEFLNEAFFVFAHKFKCPVVLVSTFGSSAVVDQIFGNSAPLSYVPSLFLIADDRMTLIERFQNVLVTVYTNLLRDLFYMPRQQALAVKYLGDSGVEIPDLGEIERQADFILVNSHPAFSTPKPYMPNMKDVAGMHLKPVKPLPADLKEYLDSSKTGVVLFSLGSAMQSVKMPENVLRVLKKSFERLPFDVLWKWENDTMADKPKNVRIGKWLPQNDLLAHPNLKLFVTHGGISSLMETVYHGVPIVATPLFGDQMRNIMLAERRGYAIYLDFQTMTENQIYEAVMKVANDPKYKENVKKVSAYWRDDLNHPLDQAVHWVEYVLKHDGAKHLKATVTEQTFVQYLLLDVAFLILTILTLTFLAVRRIFGSICGRTGPKAISKKTN